MANPLENFLKDADLIRAIACAILAALLMGYVGSVAKPAFTHAILALGGICAILGAYLSLARSQAEPELKAATGIVGAAVSVLCLVLLSRL